MTSPLPDSPLMVSLKPCRSSAPSVSIETLLLSLIWLACDKSTTALAAAPVPSPMIRLPVMALTPVLFSCSVPFSTLVSPV